MTSTSDLPAAAVPGIFLKVAAALRGDRAAFPLGYMAAFDGTRGLMTLGVLLAHTRMALFGGAMVYMDVFFTMSGYLITAILIKDYRKNGAISLGKFYARRLLRLYPAMLVMVAVFLGLSWIYSPIFQTRLIEGVVALLYLTNAPLPIALAYDYTAHTWSLSVEEQFYLVWPVVLILLLRVWGVSRKTAFTIFAVAILFWIWRIYLTQNGAAIARLFGWSDVRADALLTGCGLAILLQTVDLSAYPRFWRGCSRALAPLAVFMIVLGFVMSTDFRWYYYVSPLFGAIPAAISIMGLLHPERTLMHRIYDHPVPVFVGQICYGLYLWHFPVFVWISTWASPRYLTVFLLGWPLTFGLATLSYYFIERPFMRARPTI